MTHLTQADLDRLKALAEKATPGPWVYWGDVENSGEPAIVGNGNSRVIDDSPLHDKDGHFICASRDAVPALVAEVERLMAELETVSCSKCGMSADYCVSIYDKGRSCCKNANTRWTRQPF